MRTLIVFILFALTTLNLLGQKNTMLFKKLDINNGLSSNLINTIYKDSRGYLWIGTVNGLNCYDGNSVKTYHKSNEKKGSIPDNNISRIFEENHQRLWVVTSGGLSIFDPMLETFLTDDTLFHKNIEIPKTDIVEMFRLPENNLLIVTGRSGIYKYDPATDRVSHINDHTSGTVTGASYSFSGKIWLIDDRLTVIEFDPGQFKVLHQYPTPSGELHQSSFTHSVLADSKGNVWLFSRSEQEGLVKFNPVTGHTAVFSAESSINHLSNNIITSALEDASGNILVGTDHGGLNVIDAIAGRVKVIQNDPGDKSSIGQNSVITLFLDDTNILWVGTYKKGVSYYHPDLFKFETYAQHPFRKNWLEYEDVNTFAEDQHGNLWIGSNGGGLFYFDRANNTFKTYRHNPTDPNSLSSDVIVDICLDHRGGLWIGTYMGGLNYFDGHTFKRYLHNPDDENSIAMNNIWSIREDAERRLWIGTLGGGFDLFDRETGRFIHNQPEIPGLFSTTNVMSIAEDIEHNVWLATLNGLEKYEKATGRFSFYTHEEGNPNSLVCNSTLDVYCDRRGLVWIATREGLNMYDPKRNKFTLFTERNGLPGNDIVTVVEDENGAIWMGTPQGLCNLSLQFDKSGEFTYSVKKYDEKDGLHGKAFNEHAALKTRNGELVFGGAEGFSVFDPKDLTSTSNKKLSVSFSNLEVQNNQVEVGQEVNGRILLPQSLNYIRQIVLKHFEKTFAVSFSALDFINPEKILYHYKLEGFNPDWVTVGANARKLTYTNLHPGDYTLRVFASDIDNERKSDEIALKISVLPPFWKTKWAYSLYLVFTLLSIFYSLQTIIKRERNKFLIEQERIKTAKVHEMDMLKMRFFTNISHEIRTPLTLILSPLEKIIRTTGEGQNKEQLKLIQRNAKRLLTLINQLLDFRRLEVQGLSLLVREDDFVAFCREATESFSDLSDSRNIRLTFSSNIESLKATFDYDKIEKILFNLLSNAFKFTPEGGIVTVNVRYEAEKPSEAHLALEVCDTGMGIPDDKQEIIFERFVQSLPEGSNVNKGSGIGLSLTREFVQMHNGTISVRSKVGEGSCFRVVLPINNVNAGDLSAGGSTKFETSISGEDKTRIAFFENGKPKNAFKILLVEDNPDIRFYLKDNLKLEYQILEAGNGSDAWDVALKEIPDLIVSDIMMPVMDGLELCRKVKTDNRTSHIPVILLTARVTDQQKYEGLETGADDYIIKPFNFEILELKIRNLIDQRAKMRQSFQQNMELQPSEINITSLDEKFLKKIKDITESKMHEPDFSVEKLSSEFGISRAHLYNKLLALTGKTPIEYIRILRIRRAAQLLEKSQLTVMEIAFKVGFNDPRYFTKHFKTEYNMTPSQYAKKFFSPSAGDEKDV